MPGMKTPATAITAEGRVSLCGLQDELRNLVISLLRERIFLWLETLAFLGLNIFLFFVAVKCYFEFIGDELTKAVLASTPFLFINCLPLLLLVPIVGAKKEIASLCQELQCLSFKIKNEHLFNR